MIIDTLFFSVIYYCQDNKVEGVEFEKFCQRSLSPNHLKKLETEERLLFFVAFVSSAIRKTEDEFIVSVTNDLMKYDPEGSCFCPSHTKQNTVAIYMKLDIFLRGVLK